MYTNPGAGAAVLGVVALPNTGGNELLTAASILTITVGVAILLSTAVRQAAKKAYKA